jgi:hypothetical protein
MSQHKKSLLIFCFTLCIGLILVSCGNTAAPWNNESTTPETVIPNTVETIINDMKLDHEGIPHGIPPYYDWVSHPRLNMGNDPGTFTAMTTWGQLYEDVDGNPATNTRVEIRGLKAYILSKEDNQWHLIQDAKKIDGAAYQEDFQRDVNIPTDIRKEKDGNISVTAGDGYNFHFWDAAGRVLIDPEDIGGVFITAQARLVLDDHNQPDDREQARYLLSIGGDYWLDLKAEWDYLRTNDDIAIGRFKYVTTDWQSFNMTTLSESEIMQNPPPLE